MKRINKIDISEKGIKGEVVTDEKKISNLDTTIGVSDFSHEYPIGLSDYYVNAPNSAPLVFLGEKSIELHNAPDHYPIGLSPYNDIYKSVDRMKAADEYLFCFADTEDLSDKERDIFNKISYMRKEDRDKYLYDIFSLRTNDLSIKLAVNFVNNLIRVFPGFKDIWRADMGYIISVIAEGLSRIIPVKYYVKDKIRLESKNAPGKISFLNNFNINDDGLEFTFPSRNQSITVKDDPELFEKMYKTMHNNFLYDVTYTTLSVPEIVDYIIMKLYVITEENVSTNVIMWESTYPEFFKNLMNNLDDKPNYDSMFVNLMNSTFETFNTMKVNLITALYILRDHIRRFEVLDYREMNRPVPPDETKNQ